MPGQNHPTVFTIVALLTHTPTVQPVFGINVEWYLRSAHVAVVASTNEHGCGPAPPPGTAFDGPPKGDGYFRIMSATDPSGWRMNAYPSRASFGSMVRVMTVRPLRWLRIVSPTIGP